MIFNRFTGLLLALALLLVPQHASAQAQVTAAEIQRLQDNIADASRDVSQLRARDAALASQLQRDIDAASDEAIYFKVKLARNEAVSRTDYQALADKVEAIRARAGGSGIREAVRSSDNSDIPAGTEFDVRLQRSLSSATAQVEDRFEATTAVDLLKGDRVIVPAGSTLRGIISSVNKAGRIERKGALTVAFDQITIEGRSYPIHATVTEAIESEGIRAETGRIGTAAGVGAVIGGILGGLKGAIAGILIGGGGTIAATEGKDVELAAGTILRVRFDSGLNVR